MSEDKGKENASTTNEDVSNEKKWGRVLICGGTDWANLGRKEKKGGSKVDTSERPDLYEPHILRSLSNVKIISIHTSCAGCHCIAIDIDGNAWMFGRNAPSALGCEGEVVSETTPRKLSAKQIGAPKGTTFVHAACGRNHSLLIGSNGDVWTAGANSHGQCGQSISTEVSTFTLLRSPLIGSGSEKVTKAAAGINFSILLTESGKLYAVGSGEHGQLGNGRTGEHIAQGNKTMFDMRPEPIPVKGLEDKVITQISCGQQHTIALDSEGIVYVWGYNGYCRLGLGNQQDVLIPKVVPQFAGSNMLMRGEIVAAGPSNSIVLDRQKMFWMAGKWKNSGEGSSGSPYSSFRYMQDIMGCKMYHCASGGVTHWALAPDDDETVMTIAWGQNAANGELGLGPDQPKSATKPTRHQPLIGIDVFDIAPGQNTTYFLAAPNAKFSDLPRHPLEIDSPELCVVCSTDKGDDDAPHLGCLDPPLNAIPEGEWFCPNCSQVDDDQAATRSRRKASQKDDDAEDADGDDDEEEAREVGKKRRGRPSLNKAAKRKK